MRLWSPEDRTQLQLALELARRKPDPVVVTAEAPTELGAVVELEILFMPLAAPSGEVDRVMGFYQPTSPVAMLMGQAISVLSLKSIRTIGVQGAMPPHLRLAAVDGRRIA